MNRLGCCFLEKRIQHARVQHRVQHEDRIHEMVNDAFGIGDRIEPEQNLEEDPNEEARVRLLSIKSDWNIAQSAMDSMVDLLGELVNLELNIPQNFYQAKKLVSKLGLSYNKIHCCINGYMLFYKNDAELENCKFCGHARYKRTLGGKMVSIKAMHYLPLIPRLKRLYASMSSASHMKWHHENRRPPGVLSHPSDGEAWKHFDRTYPDFASEPRNITSDGSGDRVGPDKNSKSNTKKKSWTPKNPNDVPGKLSSQPQMHTSSSGRFYVPFGTGNPVDYHGPRKQRQVCTSYAPHIFRPPTDIGTSRLSSDIYSPFSEPWVLQRVASTSESAPPPPPPPVADDTDTHLVGLVSGDKDMRSRVFIEPDGSMHTRNVAQWLLKETKELDRGPTQLEIFRRTHLLKKTNESDPEVWVKPRAENANAEAVDGVQLAAMSQQITDLSRAFAQSVAQNKVMSKTVKDLKKQVVSMSRRRHRSPFLDSSSKEETESDEFVDTTP
ncbi:hypothetical protein FXO37_25180 [Capsicum annuum]|nr:hypothetical protein FXO37_25180 [Capsicum annuum]